jgi:hypothetical protein
LLRRASIEREETKDDGKAHRCVGSAFSVFDFVDLGWIVTGELTAPNFGGGHHFGYAVSLDGDYVAVGAPRENTWDSFYGVSVAVEAGSSAFVAGAKTTDLSIPGRPGAAVISPVSPPRFNRELQLAPTLPAGRAVTSF